MVPVSSGALVDTSIVCGRLPGGAGEAVEALDDFVGLAGGEFVTALSISHVPLVSSTSTACFGVSEVTLCECCWAFDAGGDSGIIYLVTSTSPTYLSLWNWSTKLSDWAIDTCTFGRVIHHGALISLLVNALSTSFCGCHVSTLVGDLAADAGLDVGIVDVHEVVKVIVLGAGTTAFTLFKES